MLLLDNEIAFNDGMIEEREEGVRKVEEQIGQTNEIFKYLVVLVHKQGVLIDDIQSIVDASAGATTQARWTVVNGHLWISMITSPPGLYVLLNGIFGMMFLVLCIFQLLAKLLCYGFFLAMLEFWHC